MDRRAAIHDKLVDALAPVALEIHDESHMHSVPRGAQSHFKVVVVGDAFAGLALVARHRRVNEALADELRQGLHALSIHAYTPEEWAARGGAVPSSPPCRGGSKA
ncbi:MAG TPA: BolA family protein [Nannocystaceae bacterium]|nr:BolA family protein [Nannocystaceae bacterium]